MALGKTQTYSHLQYAYEHLGLLYRAVKILLGKICEVL